MALSSSRRSGGLGARLQGAHYGMQHVLPELAVQQKAAMRRGRVAHYLFEHRTSREPGRGKAGQACFLDMWQTPKLACKGI